LTLRAKVTVGASVVTLLTIGSGATSRSPAAGASSTGPTPGLVRFRVPSGAMLPTLKLGSVITVDLHAYRTKKPQIGDIVVFHPPRGADPLTPVCGAAGEEIAFRGFPLQFLIRGYGAWVSIIGIGAGRSCEAGITGRCDATPPSPSDHERGLPCRGRK